MKTMFDPMLKRAAERFIQCLRLRPGCWNPFPPASGLAVLAVVALSGCSLGKPASASFASVVIANRTSEEIRNAAVAAFQKNGYQSTLASDNGMIFEKEGSRMNEIAYAGLAGAHYGERVDVRVRAEIVSLGDGSHRLQCRAYMVRDPGDSFFEDPVPLSNFRSGPYQRILDEAAGALKRD